MDQKRQIPSDRDILFEINNFNKIQDDFSKTVYLDTLVDNKKSQNSIGAKLTPETVKILSSINFDHFKKSPVR